MAAFNMTVNQKRALCSTTIDLSHCTPDTYEQTMADHHAVCERRPVEVGDPVRWEYGSGPHVDPRNWVEGHLTATARDQLVRIDVSLCDLGTRVGREMGFGLHGSVLCRIPRPGAGEPTREVRVGDRVRITRCWKREAVGMSGVLQHIDKSCAGELPYQIRLDEAVGTYGDWIWCEELAPVEAPGGQHDPAPPQFIAPPPLHPETIAALDRLKERAYACLGVPQGSPPRCACGDDHPPGRTAQTDPLDVVYDGATLRTLIAQNACDSQEAGPPLFLLSPAQRAAVSAHWSAQLRAKVAASREAERNRVLVDLECEPWE